MGQALYLDTGEAFLPEYALYRSRTQRPQLDLAVAANFSPWFSAGAGIHIAFALSNQADLFVPSSSSKSSSMRVRSSMKPKAGPYLGFLLAPPAATGSESSWSIGTVIRFPISSPVYFDVNSGAQQIFGAAAIDFNLSATSILQYDPLTIELGTSVKLADRLRSFFQIEFQRWSQYQAPAIQITACKNKPCGLQVADSKNPSPEMKDIWVPKIAQEYAFNSVTTLRAGYSFRPSAVRGPSTGSSNLIDPPKHTFSLGVGFQFKTLLGRNIPCRLDLHAMYQSLVTQRISKTSETEIGAPGYSAGGKIYGGGVSLSLEL